MKKYQIGMLRGSNSGIVDAIYTALNKIDFEFVSKVVLFGSVAREEDDADSDLDFAVISDKLTYAKLMRSKEYKLVTNAIYESVGSCSELDYDILIFGCKDRMDVGAGIGVEKDGLILYEQN